jgi:hypothetical protein
MKHFIEGESRNQSTLFPECLEDYVTEDNPVGGDFLFMWQWVSEKVHCSLSHRF